jgi:ABC-2 type transport system permease protein
MQIVEMFLTVTVLFFLSQLVGQHTINQHLVPYGSNYFTFAIIGVAFYGYFNVGSSVFAEKIREAQTTGTLEVMVSTPARLSTIVLASSIWGFMMTTLRVVLILGTGVLIMGSGMKFSNYPLVLLILGLTVASASSFGIISACFTIVVKRGDPVGWLFRSASWLLGGVVFPVSVLPIWMQKLALLLPTTHGLHAMRLVLLQGKSIGDLFPEIGALCLFCIFLIPISLRMLTYSVRRAKNEGSLTHY